MHPSSPEAKSLDERWQDEIRVRAASPEPDKALRHIFYGNADPYEYGSSGFLDFFSFCLSPEVLREIGKPLHRSIALEIGYGDGRLLAPASAVFESLYGIDVHAQKELAETFLSEHGSKSCRVNLLESGEKIPDCCLDFAWSYYCFQHFNHPDQVQEYFQLLRRVLTHRGVASICYGYCYEDYKRPFWAASEIKHISQISLRLRPSFVEKMARKCGLWVLSNTHLPRHPHFSLDHFGDQGRIVLRCV